MHNNFNSSNKIKGSLFIANGVVLASTLVAIMAGSASAATVFNLDSSIISGNVGAPLGGATSYGNILLAQNGDAVDVTVSLSQEWKPLSLYLNYGGSATIASSTTPIGIYPSKSVGFDLNATKVQGSGNYGNFDLSIPENGNLGNFTSIWATKLTATSGSLLKSDFAQKDSQGNLFAALHIGLGDAPAGSLGVGNTSLAIGSGTIQVGPGVPVAPGVAVPEPLTILGASTAAGFGAFFKRRLAKAKANKKLKA